MEVQIEVEEVERELQRDFEGTCGAIANQIATSEDPTRWMQILVILVQKSSSERLEMDFLPQIVQLLLGKSVAPKAVQSVNEFLQWTLATIAKRFQQGDFGQISCLARVLDAHRRFYLYHGLNNDGKGFLAQKEKSANDENELRFAENSQYTSQYFLRNLEYWGQVGGFSLFLKLLCSNASFELLQCILRILYDLKDHICAKFLAEYFPKLVDAVCVQIQTFQAAEFHVLSRDSLLEVVQVLELLLAKLQHDLQIIEALKRNSRNDKSCNSESECNISLARELSEKRVQILRLEISLRFFQSNSLEKRIYGLTEIVLIFTRLYNDEIQEQTEPTAISLFATLSFLVDWMHEKQLIQELLGEKMHVELIKRSTSLFQFASELECLPTEWIDLVWNCYHSDTEIATESHSQPIQRRHEAFRATIHDLLVEMVTFLELPSLLHLVKRIESVGSNLDSNQLDLFAAIAARTFVTPELPSFSLRERILKHLWTIVLFSSKIHEFCDEILLRMNEMLRLEAIGEEDDDTNGNICIRRCEMVETLLSSCLDNISRRENLTISLKLFTQLSALITELNIVVATPPNVQSYVKFLINEIVIYKQEIHQSLLSTQWRSMDDNNRAKLPNLKNYVSEIKNRLLALRASWILDELEDTEEFFLSENQLDALWQLMVTNSFLLDEAALFFQWIELCMNTPIQKRTNTLKTEKEDALKALMPLEMGEYLITSKFSTLSGDSITLSTLCCFHSLFRRINLLKGGLEVVSPTNEDGLISPTGQTTSSDGNKDESVELMTGEPLVGLDQLWQLAVSATDSAVAEEIITLLASFHLTFSPTVRQSEVPFQCKMRFVEKCMEFIAAAKAEAEILRTNSEISLKFASNVAVVNRCVDLLRYFLEACKSENDDSTENEKKKLIEIPVLTASEDNCEASKTLQIEHLEERLPYLDIYPSPMKDINQSDASKPNFNTGRRPSWTFRQQHELLAVIVDSNEEIDTEDTNHQEGDSVELNLDSPLRIELKPALLNSSGSPIKPNLRSPCLRANLRWPQAPSPQRGPDLRPEDVDQALTDYSEGDKKKFTNESSKSKTRYGFMSQILANRDSHFDVLLGLVDWEEATSQRTWDLLCRLPTNNELLHKMIRLRRGEKDVEWSDLLDGSSIQRLLYALRLVEALLIPVDISTANKELDLGRRQWRERFVRLGGAKHLYETLLKWPKTHQLDILSANCDSIHSQYAQNLRATCLAAVMRVLNYFFHWNQVSICEENQLSPFDVRLQTLTFPEFVKTIDLSILLQVAVKFTKQFCNSKVFFSPESAETVYSGTQICCSLIQISPQLLSMIFEPDGEITIVDDSSSRMTLNEWLKALLVNCSSKSTRIQVLGVLSEIATAFSTESCCSSSRKLFEPLLVSACDLTAQDFDKDTDLEELFDFCKVLLRSNSKDGEIQTVATALMKKNIPGRLVKNIHQIIFQQKQTIVKRKSPNRNIGVLSGYLELLTLLAQGSGKLRTTILRNKLTDSSEFSDTENLVHFIMDKLLFGDDLNTPICRTNLTREIAQNLLLTLVFPHTSKLSRDCNSVSFNSDLSILLNRLRVYQVRVLKAVNLGGRQWNYSPADSFLDTTKTTHHAGLVNPGCICYMNALVQQLFMTPGFCTGLLELNCPEISPDPSSLAWKDEIEQLQKLFVSLAYTNFRSCDPTDFAVSHKDLDGNSTDVHLQMDADEFFSLLLDRLETFIRPKMTIESPSTDKTESNSDFMARCFGGMLVNQILTQQNHLSEREEKFFALSLEVSKKRHLTESLALYVQGESLEGENAYFCEREQRKVSATKRVCIKTLPQTLVCHLKRFEFDYDTMEKLKINEFLEFPMEIDMFPYTSEALTVTDDCEKEIMYDLVGVVVHSGTSDTGHYYSFIKDRQEKDKERWLEFNDEIVREFDVETMGEECFGGEEVAQKWDSSQRVYSHVVQMKRRSAYMLIYERRNIHESSILASDSEERTILLPTHVQALATQIMQENAQFEGIVNAFNPLYEQFLSSLIENVTRMSAECDSALIRQIYQLGCEFTFGIRPLRCLNPQSSSLSSSTQRFSYEKEILAIVSWLSDSDKKVNDERVQFSKWLLSDAVASPTKMLPQYPSTVVNQVESQRTWLFDVLFLSSESPKLTENLFHVLLAAVKLLAQEAADGNEELEKSLVDFFCEVLNLFFSREPQQEVCDPVSGCVLILSPDARVTARKQLGKFIQNCVIQSQKDEKITKEMTIIHRLFLENLQFLNRFLTTLQTPLETAKNIGNSAVSARGIAPLAIETRTTTPTRERDIGLCMVQLETKLLKYLLAVYNEPAPLTVDSTLLLNHTALKNVLFLGLEATFVPFLTRMIQESETPSSKCDRLVALLIGVLEEVKDTSAPKVLAVFGALLDAEEVEMKLLTEKGEIAQVSWILHRHVFSPSRGLLESVVYYRDHRGSHDYILLLLGFTVHRASRSPILQELFRNDPQFCSHVKWIPGWLVAHLDPDGAVRTHLRANKSEKNYLSENQELQQIQKLFAEVEKAFSVAIPVFCPLNIQEERQDLISPPFSPSSIAAEDVILEALDLKDENQKDPVKRQFKTEFYLEKRKTEEHRPEHEIEANNGVIPDQKVYRPREERLINLRIDLDISNKAREA